MPLAVVSVVTMMTVGVAMSVMVTGSVMVTVRTGTRDGMKGVRREVRGHFIKTAFGQCYLLTHYLREV